MIKARGGTLEIQGASTYDGGTIVSAGTLLVNNTSGSGTGTGAVTVNSGGTLGGTGTIAGAITLDCGGAVAPGDGGIGTLFGSDLTSNSDGVLGGMSFHLSTTDGMSDLLDIGVHPMSLRQVRTSEELPVGCSEASRPKMCWAPVRRTPTRLINLIREVARPGQAR